MKVSSLTYQSGLAWLGGKVTRAIGHNTYVRVDGETVQVVYHATPVLVFHANGITQLNSGGYHSSTTKGRLCALGPMHVWQKNYRWQTTRGEFFDGIAHFKGVEPIPVGPFERGMSVAALNGDRVALAQLYDYLREQVCVL